MQEKQIDINKILEKYSDKVAALTRDVVILEAQVETLVDMLKEMEKENAELKAEKSSQVKEVSAPDVPAPKPSHLPSIPKPQNDNAPNEQGEEKKD